MEDFFKALFGIGDQTPPGYRNPPPPPKPKRAYSEYFEGDSQYAACSEYNKWLEGHPNFTIVAMSAYCDNGFPNKHRITITYKR